MPCSAPARSTTLRCVGQFTGFRLSLDFYADLYLVANLLGCLRFPDCLRERRQRRVLVSYVRSITSYLSITNISSVLLHIQVRPRSVDGSPQTASV